jgi:glutathione peroxidase
MSVLQAGGALYVDDSVINAGPMTYSSIYEFIVDDMDGNPFDLSTLRGKVCLIVNVASKCGLTCKTYKVSLNPSYFCVPALYSFLSNLPFFYHKKGLQDLYDRNNSKGLVILGFPCNQFGRQEPGTNTEIRDFARNTLKV